MASGLLRVALTGGIATGKSYCLDRFERWGSPVISADELAREIVAPGTPAFAEIQARFTTGVVIDGQIDRGRLAQLVFTDAAARRDLEAIIHPKVYAAIEAWFDALAHTPIPPPRNCAVADVPLLYETGRQGHFDRVVVVACRPEQQLERLRARDGFSETEARQRIASQLPIDTKVKTADIVIDTSGTLAETDRRCREVWEQVCLPQKTG